MKPSYAFLVLGVAVLAGCVEPQNTSEPANFISMKNNRGVLEVSRAGCMLTSAKYTNTSSKASGVVYNSISILSPEKETVAQVQLNCLPTVSGGNSICGVTSTITVKPALACSNWSSWSIQQDFQY